MVTGWIDVQAVISQHISESSMKSFYGFLRSACAVLALVLATVSASAGPLLPWNFQGSNLPGETYTVNFFGEFQTDGDGTVPVVAQQITGFFNGASIVGANPALGSSNFSFDNKIQEASPYFPGRGLLFFISDQDEAHALDVLNGNVWLGYIGNTLMINYYVESTNELRLVEVEADLRREAICNPLIQTCGSGGTVPEPAVLTLVLTALMGLVFQRRKGEITRRMKVARI